MPVTPGRLKITEVDGAPGVYPYALKFPNGTITDNGDGTATFAGDGSGTVTSVSVTTANGVSGSVATATTTPAITLTLGAIVPTTVNALTLASQAVGFTVAGGTTSKTLTVPLDATVSGTNTGDQTNISGNAATVTTNANLTGPITSTGNATAVAAQTGTGSTFVMQETPTLTTPVLGVATATSVNKVAITAPASSATLTIADGKTLTASNSLTLAGTDSTVMTFPSTTGTVATLAATQAFTNKDLTATNNSFTAASTTQTGVSELAIASEVTTGTDATRSVTPDALAGSDFGIRLVEVQAVEGATNTAVGDGAGNYRFFVPAQLNGYNLVVAHAAVVTAGTTNTTDIQIANVTDAVDMLSTKITIDSAEKTSYTAATAPVINGATDDVATGDEIRIDVDAISTTPAKGLSIILGFQLP